MCMTIYASCAANEVAVDAGVGLGGLWTNKFLAQKKMNPQPKVLVSYTVDGQKNKQHSTNFCLELETKVDFTEMEIWS